MLALEFADELLPLLESEKPSRIRENAHIGDFALSNEVIVLSAGLQGHCGKTFNSDTIDF